MFLSLLKKDIKMFLLNKSNVFMLLLLPPILILVFGFSLEHYMSGDYDTFTDGKVFYYNDNADAAKMDEFLSIATEITEETGVKFEEVSDRSDAKNDVEKSEAYAVITVSADGYDYYRSPFNESDGGRIIRSLFTQLADGGSTAQEVAIAEVKLDVQKPDSKPYYTFGGLGLAMLITSFLISGLFNKEKRSGALDRIVISPVGIVQMVLAKVVLAVIGGAIQVAVSLVVATIAFGIKWEHNLELILLIFFVLSLFSASVGTVAGAISDNNAAAQMITLCVAMLSGYLGGAITPIYLLEKTFPIKYLVKFSPLYWTNKCLSNLFNDIVDDTTRNCIIVITAISVVLILLSIVLYAKKFNKKSLPVKQSVKEATA